jgi:L-histidine Nalpha-methyltransferase
MQRSPPLDPVRSSTLDPGFDSPEGSEGLREEVARGLSQSPPTLPPKLFYDDKGSRLFEEITRLPEYYPTRTEIGIFDAHLPEMAQEIGAGVQVVEFGSGSGEKTERLLRALDDPAIYIPVDIAGEQLTRVAASLDQAFPGLLIAPLAADYTRPFRLPPIHDLTEAGVPHRRTLLFFPGSTIGNFEPEDAREFLGRAGESLGPEVLLLIGFDLVKPREALEAAYDDSRGVTAAFNRNVLVHLNRVLGTDFRPEAFQHRAPWNEEASRIEMHLVACETQVVMLPGPPDHEAPDLAAQADGHTRLRLSLAAEDHIVTEHSYKFTLDGFRDLTDAAGWVTLDTWTDPRNWFAVRLLEWRG